MHRFLVLGLAVTSLCSMSAQAPLAGKPLDWDKLQVEILERYRALVMLDTTSGHETLAVDYLKKVLEAEGIPTKTFAMNPNRANLVARLKGNGSKRPLLILAHTDVVGVQREKWPVDPFGAVIKDGYVWGRGCRSPKHCRPFTGETIESKALKHPLHTVGPLNVRSARPNALSTGEKELRVRCVLTPHRCPPRVRRQF